MANIMCIPKEIWYMICEYLSDIEYSKFTQSCKYFNTLTDHDLRDEYWIGITNLKYNFKKVVIFYETDDEYLNNIKSSTKKIEIDCNCNFIDKFPDFIEEIKLINKKCNINKWPKSLTSLILHIYNFQQMINLELPTTLTFLDLSYNFGNHLPLPSGLVYLNLGPNVVHKRSILPPLLTKLENIDIIKPFKFPDSLSYIQFIWGFNETLDDIQWPKKLVTLDLGGYYNHPIDHITFPSSLIDLKLSSKFNHPIKNLEFIAPHSLKRLQIPYDFNQYTNFSHPSLEQLDFGLNFNQTINYLPCNLKKLFFCNSSHFNSKINHWPCTLEHIKFGKKFNQNIDNLPNSLVILGLGLEFDCSIDNLPSSLSCLYFEYDSYFNQPINFLPTNLISLTLGHSFDQNIDNLPSSLVNLYFYKYSKFSKNIKKLPESLKTLEIKYEGEICDFPTSLTSLTLISINTYDQIKLPPNLVELKFPYFYNPIKKFPTTLKKLYLESKCRYKFYGLPKDIEIIYQ